MKTYAIPDALLAAAANLIKRLPAQDDVRAVLNGLENCVVQQDRQPSDEEMLEQLRRQHKIGTPRPQGGGGPGEEGPPPKPQ